MRCLGCNYDLSRSPCGPCPECGRQFDPADKATYGTKGPSRLLAVWISLICAAAPLWIYVWLNLMLVVGRFQLGRWPHRDGPDDPKHIPLVGAMHSIAGLGVLASPIVMLIGIAGLVVLSFRHHWIPALLLVVGPLIVIILFADPTRVWVWFLD